MAEALLQRGLPPRTFLNVNVPAGKPLGTRVTRQARRNHITKVSALKDPRGRPYYWIGEADDSYEPHDRSDHQAILDGCVSITPLQPDLTAHDALDLVEEMGLSEEPSSVPKRP